MKNRLTAFCHGSTLLLGAIYTYYIVPDGCGSPNKQYDMDLIYWSVGYMLYDFFAMTYYGLLDKAMTFHHWICIIGMSYPLTYGMSANYIVMGMFVAEVSNPAMNIKIILRLYGFRYTKAYETAELAFLVIYIFGRILNGTSLVWLTCRC